VEVFNRIGRRVGAAVTAEEWQLPKHEVIAAHHDDLAEAGRVHVNVLLSQERQERHRRYVTVVLVGQRSPEPLVRIQSSCLYGETLGSLACDCGGQLVESLQRMRAAGSGILVYLDQEGRGAGLSIKALAYELSERLGIDLFGAYEELGFQQDLRSYVDVVRVLRLLDVASCALLTNNPAKVKAVVDAGIAVRREPLWVGRGSHAERVRSIRREHGYLE
jgi:3,4-dihydroxy 2-butanone 4-phosphate synthase/GTP cyclohydrolase II